MNVLSWEKEGKSEEEEKRKRESSLISREEK